MDYEMRITKLEAAVDSIRDSNTRMLRAIELLQVEVAELRKLILEKTTQLDEKITALREHTDRRIDEQRDRIDDLRKHVDIGFEKLRMVFETKLAGQQTQSDIKFAEQLAQSNLKFAEQQAQTDRRFDEVNRNAAQIRAAMEQGFAECRAEASLSEF